MRKPKTKRSLSADDQRELTKFKDFLRDIVLEKKPQHAAYRDCYGEVVYKLAESVMPCPR